MTEMPSPQTSPEHVELCPACAAPARPGENFCERCGTELLTAAAPPNGVSVSAAVSGVAIAPSAQDGAVGQHDGTLLDDVSAAATDRSRSVYLLTADTDLTVVPAVCAACGGKVAPDGYCEECGAATPRVRDHFEDVPAPWVAAVCDRGIRHSRNEDAVAVAASAQGPGPGSLAVLVVCDGVSMAPDSDRASLAAARFARDAMIAGLEPAGPAPLADTGAEPSVATGAEPASTGSVQSTSRAGVLAARILAGAHAAQAEAAAAGADVPETRSPPSCTFVTGVLEHSADGTGLLVTGNIGDSRAYWFPDDGPPQLLTTDDSWAAEAIAQGIPREQAENLPQSHAITRWLGKDAPDSVPRTSTEVLDRSGWVLVCSDGLWNYASAPTALAEVVRTAAAAAAAHEQQTGAGTPVVLGLARALVDWAIGQGGSDNITVALARFDIQEGATPA